MLSSFSTHHSQQCRIHSFQTETMAITPIETLTYPRTGKRGVPQQFPRRLFEMLESEAKLASTSTTNERVIISWSTSGKAFRIADVDSFVLSVLPKYFRTKKFSSFQRNLNLVSSQSVLFDILHSSILNALHSF